MTYPLVSIITITYNRCDLIHRCIESIQRQTYHNYEHIIVDGNSIDQTEDIVKSYNDSHIKYIKLNERGPQIQMKAGSLEAKGKYVTFLDDDDEYLPTKIEKQVALFELVEKKARKHTQSGTTYGPAFLLYLSVCNCCSIPQSGGLRPRSKRGTVLRAQPERGDTGHRRMVAEGQKKTWRLPTLPHLCSTIGVRALDFRVRDGNGYFHSAMATRSAHMRKPEV